MRALRIVAVSAFTAFTLAATMGLGACTAGMSCTAKGCVDDVTAKFELPASVTSGGRVTVCAKGTCTDVLLPVPCKQISEVPGAPQIYCFQDSPDDASSAGRSITVFYEVPFHMPPVEGEVFTFRITDGKGALVAERTGAVTYSDYYPNGPECGGACKHGSVP